MGPKKIVAKQEVIVEPDIDTTEVLSGKKTPGKRVAKPKQTKDTNIESNETKDTNIESNESNDEKFKNITEQWKVYNKKSETLRAELETVDSKISKLLIELNSMVTKYKNLNDNKLNDNTCVFNKPITSAKSSKKKDESSDSSNDKESSDNETNSDDDNDIKKKPQPKSKNKNLTLGTSGSETKPPAKPSRAKAKAHQAPVLNVGDSDSDSD
jgi:hypothetical protein